MQIVRLELVTCSCDIGENLGDIGLYLKHVQLHDNDAFVSMMQSPLDMKHGFTKALIGLGVVQLLSGIMMIPFTCSNVFNYHRGTGFAAPGIWVGCLVSLVF